ncbi:MAG: hypothetical protein QXW83_02975 [Nitrososphaerales archaeon]
MKKKELYFILLTLLLLFLSLPSIPITFGEIKIEIGFSPKRLFDINLGSPIFMPFEQLWINVFDGASVRLKNPLGNVIKSLRVMPNTPTLIYTFNQFDTQGLWYLEVISTTWSKVIPIYLEGVNLNARVESLKFALQNDTLVIQGNIAIKNINHEGGMLLLIDKKAENQTLTISSKSNLGDMPIYLEIIQNPNQFGVLILKPYAPSLKITTLASVWAEISIDLPLIKSEDNRSVIIYTNEVIAKTSKMLINITTIPNEGLKLQLPKIHEVGRGGLVPFRPSIGVINFYLQIDDLIYTLNTKFLFIPDVFSKSVKGFVELNPLSNTFPYEFALNLQNLSTYQLILILRVNGVDKIWSTDITPLLAKVKILNQLTHEIVKDYEISFDKGVIDSIIKDGETYALLDNNEVSTTFNLIVNGIQLLNDETKPNILNLKPFTENVINVNNRSVSFLNLDYLDNPIKSGRIKIFREGLNKSSEISIIWNNDISLRNISLPINGIFKAIVEVDGFNITKSFIINDKIMLIKIQLEKYIKGSDFIVSTLFYLSVIIIIIEIFIAIKVWLRAIQLTKA